MLDLFILAIFGAAGARAIVERRQRRSVDSAAWQPTWQAFTRRPWVLPRLSIRPLRGVGFSTPARIVVPTHPLAAGVVLIIALLLTWLGQHALIASEIAASAAALWIAGLALFVALERAASRVSEQQRPQETAAGGHIAGWLALTTSQPSRLKFVLLGPALTSSLLAWLLMRGRPPSAGHLDIALLWLLSIGLAILATTPGQLFAFRSWQRPRGPMRLVRVEWLLAGAIVLVALVLRATALDQFPYVFGGDEGSQAMPAVDVLEGKLTNPFGTVWYSVPTLFMFLQAGSIALFGDSVAGVRAISAAIGAASVLATYALANRLFGRPTAVVAGLLLAVFHYHIHFSRLASIQIGDALWVVLAIYFLDRAFSEGRRSDFLLAGMVLGISQYFYFGSRLLPAVAVAYVGFLLFRGWVRTRGPNETKRVAIARLRMSHWIVVGALLVYAPLLAHYMDHPTELNARVNQVSMFASGWLSRAAESTGTSPLELVINQIRRAAFLPFHTGPGGWYLGPRPFIGLPVAVPVAIGLAVATAGALQPKYFGVAVAYWGTVLGLGLTEDPTQTQRFVIASPLLAVFAALGITSAMRVAAGLVRIPRPVVLGVGTAAVAAIGIWNLQYYFGSPAQLRLYGDTNSLVATELSYHLRSLGPGYTVYFIGPPRMFYYGFQTLPFIARGARGIDVERPWTPDSPPPTLGGPTVFAALPERAAELETVRAWFPGGELREFRWRDDLRLFTVYRVPPG